MTALDLTRTPRRACGYAVEQVDDELLLYHAGRTSVVYLNQTALMIWQLCDGRRSSGDITLMLTGAFPDDHLAVAQDVTAAIEQLVALGVITLE